MRAEESLGSARNLAANAFKSLLRPGDRAVDATLGNGHDCVRLCELVGDGGRVYGFDIQPQALENTRSLLASLHMENRAELFLAGHERMAEFVPPGIRLAAFNLGWLPGADKGVTTKTDSTLLGVKAALSLLDPGGMAVICVYPGHEEGEREQDALINFAACLPPAQFTALWHQFLNGGPGAPGLLMIEKLAKEDRG
jgi:SAM-dependent methyltransferase